MKNPLQKIEYDKSVDALYIYANSGKIHRTIELNHRVLFDVDKNGKLIGIEILDASKFIAEAATSLPKKIVEHIFAS